MEEGTEKEEIGKKKKKLPRPQENNFLKGKK